MTTFPLPIDRTAATPIYQQIYDGLRQAILSGRLRSGERIPSSRRLAEDLCVSRFPVLAAYDQLLHEGYLTGRAGSGTYVSSAVPDDLLHPLASQAVAHPTPSLRSTPSVSAVAGTGPFEIDLPALDQFPHAAWSRMLARHARALTPAQMSYDDPAGMLSLRVAIADHLRTARAVRCEADQVILVSGSQAALRLSAAVLLQPGDRVAIEEPGYFGARNALSAGGAELIPVPVDSEGLSVASLPGRRKRVRAVYVTPSHQYPLGASMSMGRRFALLEWARRQDAWVLEDDYDSEFRYVSRPLGSLQGMDAQARVIYIGTFSKALFPAMRVGYLVVPPSLREEFLAARKTFDFAPPSLYQLVLAEFLADGHFARHLRRMRGVYLERRNALLTGVEQHCAGRLAVHNADGGLHVTALLPDGSDDLVVVRRLAECGLIARALTTCYLGTSRRPGLLLGFGASTAEQLREACRVLGEVLSGAEGAATSREYRSPPSSTPTSRRRRPRMPARSEPNRA